MSSPAQPAQHPPLTRRSIDRGGMTLEECAAELGCSQQRVQQLERSALKKLRCLLIREFGDDALELLSAVPDAGDRITTNDKRVIHYRPGAEP